MRESRDTQGIAVEEVVARLRIPKERYLQIEKGVVTVTIQFFAKFLFLFEIESIDFFGVRLLLHSKEPVASYNQLGNQIRKSRVGFGHSLRALAEQVGISHTGLRNLEKGAKRVMLLTLIRLDHALGKDGTVISGYFLTGVQEVSRGMLKSAEMKVGEERIQIPLDMPDLTSRCSYWQQKLAPILWCIAVKGSSTAQDIGLIMGEEYQAFNPAFQRLEELRLIESFKGNLLGPIKLYRLSEMGKTFCEEMGWVVIKSDLEVLFDGHQGREQLRHTAAVLYFANKARSQGDSVILLPEISVQKSKYQPDILISNGTDEIYFEVELKARGKIEKWKWQMELQGFVAFFTLNSFRRIQIESQVKDIGIEKIFAMDMGSDCDLSRFWGKNS